MAFAASTGFHRPPTAHLSAVPDRDPFADVSASPIKAYQAYQAAIEDPHRSCADLARLTGTLKLERQSDRERARYYRMQAEEAAVLADAAAGPYASDDYAACVLPFCAWVMYLARSHRFISATGGLVSISLCALSVYMCYLFCPHCGCWTAAFAASCQQGGGHSHTFYAHIFMLFLCVLYFSFTYSSIFRERESSETILLFSDSGGSEVEPCEDGARPVTGSPFIGPPEPFFLFARCKPKE